MDDNAAIAELLIKIQAKAEGLEQVAEEAKARLQGIGNAADQTKKPLKDAGKAGRNAGKDIKAGAREAELAWLALSVTAALVFKRISDSILKGIKDANDYKDALRGLTSVADSTGISSSALEKATAKVVDEFFNATAAATAFKNLLLRGYTLDQATDTIIRLKDAAAFGRQASLSLSDAVKSATEGLKNENSILVDNAGVTKNVAKMWEEYAKQRGISTATMTQAQKVEAEYQGIQQETAAMTGDIAKLQDELSGKLAKTENQAYLLSRAFGGSMTPAASLMNEVLYAGLSLLTGITETLPGVTAGATAATASFLGMLALYKVIDMLKSLHAKLVAINATLGTMGKASIVIGLLTLAYTAYKNHLEKVSEAEEKRIQQNKEAVIAQKERLDQLDAMISRYAELKNKQQLTYSEALELKSIENELAEQYGITKGQVEDLTGSTDTYRKAIENLTKAERENLLLKQQQQSADALKSAQDSMADSLKRYNEHTNTADLYEATGSGLPGDVAWHREMAEKAKQEVQSAYENYLSWLDTQLLYYQTEASLAGKDWNDTVSQTLTDAFTLNIDPTKFKNIDAFEQFMEGMASTIANAASSPAVTEAYDVIQGVWDKIQQGVVPSAEEFNQMKQAFVDITADPAVIASWQKFRAEMHAMGVDVSALETDFFNALSPIKFVNENLFTLEKRLTAEAKVNREARSFTVEQTNALIDQNEALNTQKDTFASLKEKSDAYYSTLDRQEASAQAIQHWRDLTEQLKETDVSTDAYAKTMSDLIATARELGIAFDGTPEDLARTTRAVDLQAAGMADTAGELENTRRELQETISDLMRLGPEALSDTDRFNLTSMFMGMDGSEARTEGLQAFGDFFDGYKEQFDTGLDDAKEHVTENLGTWNDELADQLSLLFRYALNNAGIEDPELGTEIADKLIGIIAAAISDENTEPLFDTLTEFTENIMQGISPSDEEIEEAALAWAQLFGADSPILAMFDDLDLTNEQLEAFKELLLDTYDPLNIFGEGMDVSRENARNLADSFADVADEISDTEKALKEYDKTLRKTQSDLRATTAMTQQVKQWKELYKAFKDAKAGGKDVSAIIRKMTPYIKKMTGSFDGSEKAIDDTNAAFERMAAYIPQRAAELENQISALEQQLWELDAADPNVWISGSAAILIAAIAAAKAELLELLELMAEAGITSYGGGGGGGGGGGDRGGGSRTIEKSAYEKEIEQLEHLKALDQLTYEQELEHLEDISARRIADAEERLDLEERIYDVKKSIMERDAENLTDLTDGLMDALAERYDKMRDAETEALDQSREAWEEWRDHNVSAIEEQIAALDALDDAEDRQADQEEHLRKIAMLEQGLAYEQDAYNQMQLQKQLDAANEDYAKWQREAERDEQRAALEAQIDAINAKADSEIDALDAQREAIDAYYDERTTQANLQAEAELELMNSTQQQIIDLLTEYAPDYDAAGRSLGEKFMDGFTSVVGTFNDWFTDFEAKVTDAVDSMQAANVAAAAQRTQAYDENGNPVSGITINQENNFNTPVETPAETARRIQQANEDLAEQIAGE